MQNNRHHNEIEPENQRSDEDIREDSKKHKLPCGAPYCFRCHEECGVLVNAYIMRDIANEPAQTIPTGWRKPIENFELEKSFR